ncbi:hypothetical protein PZB74_13535 [Porifericola rhodea]|uniref:hypothetical protein n=1 Tax=Porifericola rhodea TaxID=930972 RepID=UPI002665B065|nr:hypothetical protein [Porifericola rhodea]WKN29987.1 hypothetical protein PZB74_13535 [Porifericola rhodea]
MSFFKIFNIARILSLDVVLGAVVSSLFIAKYMGLLIPVSITLALGECVWLIYTLDHLSDARAIPHQANTPRHRFHQKYFKALSIIFILVSIGGLITLSFLPLRLIVWGCIIMLFVALYFWSIQFLELKTLFHKEVVSALLYCLGIFLPAYYANSASLPTSVYLLFAQYLGMALCNLLLLAWYEKDVDTKDQHTSLAVVVNERYLRHVIQICLLLVYGLAVVSFLYFNAEPEFRFVQFIVLGMATSLQAILSFPAFFSAKELYRSLADAIFFFPLIYLLLP